MQKQKAPCLLFQVDLKQEEEDVFVAQQNAHMFSLSLILLSISNNRGIKRPVKELLAMQGLFQAIVHKRGNLYFWTPILLLPPSHPLPGESEQFCAFSRFQHSGYLKCQDIYSAYVWKN